MTLADYIGVLRRRLGLIMLVVIFGLVTAGVTLVFGTKIYEATSTVRVATGVGGADAPRVEDLDYSDRLMTTYKELAESRDLRGRVAEATGADEPADLTVELPPNTELLEISVEASDATLAQRQANEAARVLVERAQELASESAKSTETTFSLRVSQLRDQISQSRQDLEQLAAEGAPEEEQQALRDSIALQEEGLRSLVEQSTAAQGAAISRAATVSIYDEAGLPSSPAKPRPALTMGLGLFLGLLTGLGLAFVRESLDRRLHTRDEVAEVAGSMVMGTIPRSYDRRQRLFNSASPQQDAFARLRTNLMALDGGSAIRKLMVTSAEPGAGKSTITANLAAALARDGTKVVAVDADLRIPTLHRLFELQNTRGLSSVLTGRVRDERELIQRTQIDNLFVLTSGPEVPDPAERIGSVEMANLVTRLAEAFEVVLIDTPALLSVSDGANVVPLVDSVLLVAREARSTRHGVRDARAQLAAVNAKRVNVVLNFSREQPTDYYYYTSFERQRDLWEKASRTETHN
ncbi:MAG TPA: polysaccharide biosynthesis tyrosine autokinase [Thermoleophilaceae bacterium]|nr:polysaccharide biosynthesis tyrosine autokinase [Thermoleophilaceae bacterium]